MIAGTEWISCDAPKGKRRQRGGLAVHSVRVDVEINVAACDNCLHTQLSVREGKTTTREQENAEFEEFVLVEHLEMEIMRCSVRWRRKGTHVCVRESKKSKCV